MSGSGMWPQQSVVPLVFAISYCIVWRFDVCYSIFPVVLAIEILLVSQIVVLCCGYVSDVKYLQAVPNCMVTTGIFDVLKHMLAAFTSSTCTRLTLVEC